MTPAPPRVLTYEPGALHFYWRIVSQTIEVMERTAEGLRPVGRLSVIDADGEVTDYEQEAFEAHCNWFIRLIAAARLGIDPDG